MHREWPPDLAGALVRQERIARAPVLPEAGASHACQRSRWRSRGGTESASPICGDESCCPFAVPDDASLGPAPSERTGRDTVKVVPRPITLETPTRPPCASAMLFTIARPRPVPPLLRERALSTR